MDNSLTFNDFSYKIIEIIKLMKRDTRGVNVEGENLKYSEVLSFLFFRKTKLLTYVFLPLQLSMDVSVTFSFIQNIDMHVGLNFTFFLNFS